MWGKENGIKRVSQRDRKESERGIKRTRNVKMKIRKRKMVEKDRKNI